MLQSLVFGPSLDHRTTDTDHCAWRTEAQKHAPIHWYTPI